MTPPDEPNMGTVVYRLDLLDKRLERMEGNITTLQYPSLALYHSEQTAQNDRIATAVTLAMWALGLVCALVLGAVVTAIATVVG